MRKLTNKQKVMNSPLGYLVTALVEKNDDFLEELAKELMLDELLCGEADPKQFLIDTMKRIHRERVIRNRNSVTKKWEEGYYD